MRKKNEASSITRTQQTYASRVGGRAAWELEALLADGLGQRRRSPLPVERLAPGLGERQQRASERGERGVARRQRRGRCLRLASGERCAAAGREEPWPARIVGVGSVDRIERNRAAVGRARGAG